MGGNERLALSIIHFPTTEGSKVLKEEIFQAGLSGQVSVLVK